jgi:hypothetical protein
MSVGRRRHTPLALRQTRGRRICHLSVGGRPAISAARIRFSILGASSHSFSQLGWPQRWRGCVRRRRTHRPVGRTGRCVGPSIRPCRWRWYPTACAQGWCSRRNRSGDKSRHRRARTTPVGGSPRRPVGRRTGEPRRCRVAKGREDLPRGTIRDLSTAHRSKASTKQLAACSASLQGAPRRPDLQARTASAAPECGSAAAGRAERVVLLSAVSITFDREEITRNKSLRSLRTALTQHVRRSPTPEANRPGTLEISRSFGHRGNLSFTGIRQPWLAQSVKWSAAAEQLPRLPRCQSQSPGRRRPG